MPRRWKTVYSSSHKRVLVRPRKRHHHVPAPPPPVSVTYTPPDDTWEIILTVLGVAVGVVVLYGLILLVIDYWPIILVGLLIVGIARLAKR